MSINRVEISGNLGRDPELRATSSGMQVLQFSVCVNTRVKRNGEWQDKPNWVDCTMFGQRAESVSRYIKKGSHVTVAGRLNQNTWEKNGQKRSKLEVVCEDIDFAGGSKADAQDAPQGDFYDDDIPF